MLNFKNILHYETQESGIAEIIYDINYINPAWNILIQKYAYSSYLGNSILLESHFDLYTHKSDSPSILSDYSKMDKIILWETIFELKEYYFNRHQPDIVEHFIDGRFIFTRRLNAYQKYLHLPNYEYLTYGNSFYLVKRTVIPTIKYYFNIE